MEMKRVHIAFWTCVVDLMPVFAGTAKAPWLTRYVSSTAHTLTKDNGAYLMSQSIQNTAASGSGRLHILYGSNAPYPLYNSSRGEIKATANPNLPFSTPAITACPNPTAMSVTTENSGGYFAVT